MPGLGWKDQSVGSGWAVKPWLSNGTDSMGKLTAMGCDDSMALP